MKLYLIILNLFLFITGTAFSQWTNQNPVPDGNDLWATFFVDDNTGWIVGSDGFIKKTTNAGNEWIEQNSGTNLILKAVQFVNENTGWICGESGLILKTTNGGSDWFSLISGTTQHLTDIQFCSSDIGYISGFEGTILKTTDGGLSWLSLNTGTTNDLYSVNFIDELQGYSGYQVGDSSYILKTTDGGINWSSKVIGYSIGKLNTVKFINADTGYVGGGHSISIFFIYKTTDGGNTWTQSNVSNLRPLEVIPDEQQWIYYGGGINSIYFKDQNIGYAVSGWGGWDRGIFTTTDGGTTWSRKYYESEADGILSVYGNSQGKAWAVGRDGVIFTTEDDGNSWAQLLSGSNAVHLYSGDFIYSIFMINENVGWAAGKRNKVSQSLKDFIFKTTNGGKIWKTQFLQGSSGVEPGVKCIYFINDNLGWAVGEREFFRTTDSGENWITDYGIGGSSVFFIDQNTGWVTSDKDYTGIYKSTDGGITWEQKSAISSSSIFFINNNIGWAVGADGNILKSTDGGESWSIKTANTTNDLNSVKFYNSNLGVCVGEAGAILLTTDGGENWILQNAGTNATLKAIEFINSNTIWIVGSQGTILKTTDSGNSWTLYNELTENDLTSLCFADEHTGWFGGMNGTIFKYQEDVVPVELVSFTANVINNAVELNWETATEINNYGFNIERKTVDQQWNNIGFVEGQGNSTSKNSYSFIDKNLTGTNKFQYRLKQLDTDGSFKYSNEVEVEITPNAFILYQNYPNPFNPSTVIEFSFPEAVDVSLTIYDALGQKITELVNNHLEAGYHRYQWNAPQSGITTGVYFYELKTEKFVTVKKMLLMK